MTVYKIQNREGKFSTGGLYYTTIRWTTLGKVWRSLAALKSHVTQVRDIADQHNCDDVYEGCRVVEYTLTPARVFAVERAGEIN